MLQQGQGDLHDQQEQHDQHDQKAPQVIHPVEEKVNIGSFFERPGVFESHTPEEWLLELSPEIKKLALRERSPFLERRILISYEEALKKVQAYQKKYGDEEAKKLCKALFEIICSNNPTIVRKLWEAGPAMGAEEEDSDINYLQLFYHLHDQLAFVKHGEVQDASNIRIFQWIGDLTGMNLARKDFHNSSFHGVTLGTVNLSNANCEGVDFTGTSLEHCDTQFLDTCLYGGTPFKTCLNTLEHYLQLNSLGLHHQAVVAQLIGQIIEETQQQKEAITVDAVITRLLSLIFISGGDINLDGTLVNHLVFCIQSHPTAQLLAKRHLTKDSVMTNYFTGKVDSIKESVNELKKACDPKLTHLYQGPGADWFTFKKAMEYYLSYWTIFHWGFHHKVTVRAYLSKMKQPTDQSMRELVQGLVERIYKENFIIDQGGTLARLLRFCLQCDSQAQAGQFCAAEVAQENLTKLIRLCQPSFPSISAVDLGPLHGLHTSESGAAIPSTPPPPPLSPVSKSQPQPPPPPPMPPPPTVASTVAPAEGSKSKSAVVIATAGTTGSSDAALAAVDITGSEHRAVALSSAASSTAAVLTSLASTTGIPSAPSSGGRDRTIVKRNATDSHDPCMGGVSALRDKLAASGVRMFSTATSATTGSSFAMQSHDGKHDGSDAKSRPSKLTRAGGGKPFIRGVTDSASASADTVSLAIYSDKSQPSSEDGREDATSPH